MPQSSFHPVIQAWFQETYGAPSPPQAQGWPVIAGGRNCLILAPTGSGKTLAAFLKCLDELYKRPEQNPGVKLLYISPLKALNNDIHRNLEVPLAGIEAKARAMGVSLPRLTRALRTGDTSQSDRAAMAKHPPDILITTPESLYLMLTSQVRRILKSVEWVIVDEIHAISGNKRGIHLSISLERLEALLPSPPVRIGLSATQRPLEEIARYLGGVGRSVQIVDTGARKDLDLQVEVPLDDMRALPENTIWSAIHPRLLELVAAHQSTIIFVNSRGLAERLTERLNGLAGGEIARVHHGSMSREVREQVEGELKAGRLPCLVATSSLELGIDIGAVDLVVQVESPKSVARGLQRVGRAGHVLGAASKGRLLPKFRGDLLETACIVREMRRGEVEETRIPTGALDVLAQQVTAMAAMDEWAVQELLQLLRRSYCYRDLTERQLFAVLEMLSGRYPSEEFRELRPRIVWEKEKGLIRGREGAKTLAILSGGTIPDRGYYGVYIAGTTVKVGEMDEEFVYESRVGDVFLLGTATWRIQGIEHDRITVVEALGATPRMPFWKGDDQGRPYEMGLKLGRFTREVLERLDSPGAQTWLESECRLAPRAAENLLAYLRDQQDSTGAVPTDQTLVAELFWDEVGDRRLVIHSPFGGKVHQAWRVVLQRRIRQLMGVEVEMTISDDGLMVRFPGADGTPDVQQLLRVPPDEAAEMLLEEVGNTAVFGAYFRMNATRAMILPRPRPGRRRPFWLQRLKAADLLQVARKYDSFPVVLETYREVLRDVMDMKGLRQVLDGLRDGSIGLDVVETETPSPMAASTMFTFVGEQMYEGDTPKAERRAALLNINRALLREVLGSEKLRELLDLRAITDVHERLQRLAEGWRPRNADELEDLLRRLGDQSPGELTERGVDPAWLDHRMTCVEVGGESRWLLTEELPMYTDVQAFAGALIRRFARNRGPFVPGEVARRYGLTPETVERYLAALQAEGLIVAGEYTQGVVGREYCDVEVLQQIHRRTLSVLRQEIEPVDGEAYCRFLLSWQGIGLERPAAARQHALRRTLSQLQALALPAECWEREILPARLQGYQPTWLDQLCAMGELHWAATPGRKLAFIMAEQLDRLPNPFAEREAASLSPEAGRVLETLEQGGADFLGAIARRAGLTPTRSLEALWELVWAGLATNDTFAPVRQAMRVGSVAARRGRPISLQTGTGRWSATSKLVLAERQGDPAEGYARLLLQRHGVVCRESLQIEEGPPGWQEVLAALKRMELRGQVRQGYFIRELSGVQFALPEAVERLRAARSSPDRPLHLICACDPANPYGAVLTMPESTRMSRLPSTFLVLEGGLPVLLVESYGRRLEPLVSMEKGRLRAVLACCKELLNSPARALFQRRLEVETWGADAVLESPVSDLLQELGFERSPKGLVLYR